MKKLFLLFLLIPFLQLNAQKIGRLAPDTSKVVFPPHAWGVNLMFGEGGFGLGTFYKKELSNNLYGFIDFSISESKDEREFEYIDYWGIKYVFNKKNRVFLLPVNLGIQYRLWSNSLTDNFRPFISAALGPTFAVTNPYDKEFFEALGYSQMKIALGGYVAIGTNFGVSKSSLLGITIKYSFVHFFDDGVENLYDRYRKDIGTISLSFDLGVQF
jgi:hypothetical protein